MFIDNKTLKKVLYFFSFEVDMAFTLNDTDLRKTMTFQQDLVDAIM